ncbi:unnamed protein product [Closterium sp. Naga37s-1]|nr:unnamed protein product [Closterium sp. Naga37s-1]
MLSCVLTCPLMLSRLLTCPLMLSRVLTCPLMLSRVLTCPLMLSRVLTCPLMLSRVLTCPLMLSRVLTCPLMLSRLLASPLMLSCLLPIFPLSLTCYVIAGTLVPLSVPLVHSHILFHSHPPSNTIILSHPLSYTLIPSHPLSSTLTHSHPLPSTLIHSHTLSYTPTPFYPLSYTLIPSHPLSFTLIHSYPLSYPLMHSHPLSFTLIRSRPLSYTLRSPSCRLLPTFRLPPAPLRISSFNPPQAWESAYDLAEGTIRPPAKISLPPNVPPPPHLEDCAARTAFRESTEKRAANGESPKWSNSSEACAWVPQPPWVGGGELFVGRSDASRSPPFPTYPVPRPFSSLHTTPPLSPPLSPPLFPPTTFPACPTAITLSTAFLRLRKLPSSEYPPLPMSANSPSPSPPSSPYRNPSPHPLRLVRKPPNSPLPVHPRVQIRGPDAGNLAATRRAQRYLWERQFPASCKERKLVLIEWSPLERHGLGSQLHIMTALFSLAVSYNRTFLPMPGTYMRANHSECQAIGKASTFECYFFPMVSKECEDIAMAEHNAGRIPPCPDFRDLEGALKSDSPVVCAKDEDYNRLRVAAQAIGSQRFPSLPQGG